MIASKKNPETWGGKNARSCGDHCQALFRRGNSALIRILFYSVFHPRNRLYLKKPAVDFGVGPFDYSVHFRQGANQS